MVTIATSTATMTAPLAQRWSGKYYCAIVLIVFYVLVLQIVVCDDVKNTLKKFTVPNNNKNGDANAAASTMTSAITNLITEEDENRTFDDDETSETLSFGIRSFTVEVTTASEKPPLASASAAAAAINSNSNLQNLQTNDIKINQVNVTNDSDIKSIVVTPITIDGSHTQTSNEESDENEINIGKSLKNGLYRIKIAEIITDEFDNGLSEESVNRNMENERNSYNNNKGKINIADLYPSKIEDFSSIIKDSNVKLIREKLIGGKDDVDDSDQSSSDAIDAFHKDGKVNVNIPTTKIEIELIDEVEPPSNRSGGGGTVDKITDFTSQLLKDSDGVISTIEKNFLSENLEEIVSTQQPSPPPPPPLVPIITVNKPVSSLLSLSSGFIDRRVKKFDPATRYINEVKHVDIASTKFNSDGNGENRKNNEKPEFSTTKFYNSKELYNEMIHRRIQTVDDDRIRMGSSSTNAGFNTNNNGDNVNEATTTTVIAAEMRTTKPLTEKVFARRDTEPPPLFHSSSSFADGITTPISTTTRITPIKTTAALNSVKGNEPKPPPFSLNINTPKLSENSKMQISDKIQSTRWSIATPQSDSQIGLTSSAAAETTLASKVTGTATISTLITRPPPPTQPPTVTATSTTPITTMNSVSSATTTLSAVSADEKYKPTTTISYEKSITPNSEKNMAKPPSISVSAIPSVPVPPIRGPRINVRGRVLTRLQEKINSLECDMQNVPSDSNVWRGNETHELSLPNTVS